MTHPKWCIVQRKLLKNVPPEEWHNFIEAFIAEFSGDLTADEINKLRDLVKNKPVGKTVIEVIGE